MNVYSKILESYSKRLISTDSRSRTLFFPKDGKNGFDLYKYVIDDLEEFKKFLETPGSKMQITIPKFDSAKLKSYLQWWADGDDTVLASIKSEVPHISEHDLYVLREGKVNNRTIVAMVNKYEKSVNNYSKQFVTLSRVNENEKKQKGKDDLFVGYPFIEGCYNKDTVVRAPVVLHKISLEFVSNKVYMINEGTKFLNPVLVMSFLVENELKYRSELEFELDTEGYLEKAYALLKDVGIKIKENDIEYRRIPQITKGQFREDNDYFNNEFVTKEYSSMGIFPISNKRIYDDIKELRDSDVVNAALSEFYDSSTEAKIFDDDVNYIDEKSIKYITILDYSQKKTLEASLKGNHIIQGPPGTGKSQVIANIVANGLLQGKKYLVCSEKRTATDVIYNRLGRMSSFALLLHDQVSEKEFFFENVKNAVNKINENINEYKKNEYRFKQDRVVMDFFEDSVKYNDIVSRSYNGLSYKEVLDYKAQEVLYENEMKAIYENIDDYNNLDDALYDYDRSETCAIYKDLKKEVSKDFYTKNGLKLDDDRVYSLWELEELLNSKKVIKNNYLKNVYVHNFFVDNDIERVGISFFKKLFKKKEPLDMLTEEILDTSKHDFSIFKDKIYKDKYNKALVTLKFVEDKKNKDIIECYKIYAAFICSKDIDEEFVLDYTKDYEFNRKDAFKQMDAKIDESIEFILRTASADVKEKIIGLGLENRLNALLGECEKSRKKAIKVIIEEYFDVLQILFPIWIMTPDVVSGVIPLKEGIFDKVIFDEASQLFIEKAVPSIARCKSAVICGDSKQLRPTLFFESRYEDDEEDVSELEQESAVLENSLLDYAVATKKFNSSMLQYHYRCDHKELINFSSNAFYNNNLIFATKNPGNEPMPIQTFNIDGKWDGMVNRDEAKKVVEIVKDILKNRKKEETIGIVTLNIHQRDLILEMLDETLMDDKEVGSTYVLEKDRVDPKNGEDESLFVKNLEGVQGDERDIIIFSIAYAKDEKGKIGSSLGEIQRLYGENRLNVAITRAKKKIYIVKSFMGSDLSINESNNGPRFFKKYLQYADMLNEGNIEGANNILHSLVEDDSKAMVVAHDTPIEKEVYEKLKEFIDLDKYEIRTNVPLGSFQIDVGIYDKIDGSYILGIECVGPKYNYTPSQVCNDVYRQNYLNVRGWQLYRIWSTDWWNNYNKELNMFMDCFLRVVASKA